MCPHVYPEKKICRLMVPFRVDSHKGFLQHVIHSVYGASKLAYCSSVSAAKLAKWCIYYTYSSMLVDYAHAP